MHWILENHQDMLKIHDTKVPHPHPWTSWITFVPSPRWYDSMRQATRICVSSSQQQPRGDSPSRRECHLNPYLWFGGRPQERVLCDVRGQVQLRKVSGERLSSRSGLEVLGTKGQKRNSWNSDYPSFRLILIACIYMFCFLGVFLSLWHSHVPFSHPFLRGEHQALTCPILGQMGQWVNGWIALFVDIRYM